MTLENKLKTTSKFLGITALSYAGVQALQYGLSVANGNDINLYNHIFSIFSGIGLTTTIYLGKEKIGKIMDDSYHNAREK